MKLMMKTIAAHPGHVLADKLSAVGVLPTELARQLNVPANRITQIIHGKRGITGDSALRLAHWFGDPPEFWMGLQAKHELSVAPREAGRLIRSLPTGTKYQKRPPPFGHKQGQAVSKGTRNTKVLQHAQGGVERNA